MNLILYIVINYKSYLSFMVLVAILLRLASRCWEERTDLEVYLSLTCIELLDRVARLEVSELARLHSFLHL